MDTSEIYVEMCEKAEELQERWTPKLGDWCISPQRALEVITKSKWQVSKWDGFLDRSTPPYLAATFGKGGEATWSGYVELVHFIWLPCQDQLQAMLGDKGLQTLTWQLHEFSLGEHGSRFTINGSMEQLWLAFVMHEKYGKVWDGEDWI